MRLVHKLPYVAQISHSYDLNFKLKIVAEAEAVNNNREIPREHGISELMARKWRNQQDVLFSGFNTYRYTRKAVKSILGVCFK